MVQEVRKEVVMPVDAPLPQVLWVSNSLDRQADPTTLQAKVLGMFTAEALMAALEPMIESAALSAMSL